jgi:hypothetical protein
MKRHPVDSEKTVKGVNGYRAYLPGIRHHHERHDRGGHPDGIRGEHIPFEARVLAIADAFEAMTSSRVYRAVPMSQEGRRSASWPAREPSSTRRWRPPSSGIVGAVRAPTAPAPGRATPVTRP